MDRDGAPARPVAATGMPGRLAGKVAVVTGGASGIGAACALIFAAEGAAVIVADIADGAHTVAQIEAAGGRARFVRTDATDEAQCDALVAEAVVTFGAVDILVASAGIATAAGRSNVQARAAETASGDVVSLAPGDFRRVLDVNVIGVMQTARAAARQMLRQGGGSIITIASTAARIPLAGAAPYCVSKAGVWMLMQVMALELARTGIRVNAVGPGYTATPLIAGIETDPRALAMAMRITPMNRLGRADEIARACLYLAGDEASFITGQMLHPAGGQFTD